MKINHFGIVENPGLPTIDDFIRPIFKKVEIRTCRCGQTFELRIPYEFANPGLRDLCADCILEAP